MGGRQSGGVETKEFGSHLYKGSFFFKVSKKKKKKERERSPGVSERNHIFRSIRG